MDTLKQFNDKFGTEQQCVDYLASIRWPDGFCCPRCQYDEFWQIANRKYKCKKCGYQTTVTSGTFFQDSHISLDKWLKAAWYLTSTEERKTAVELQKLLDLGSNRTALLVMDKYASIWEGCVDHRLEGVVEVQTRKVVVSRKKEKKTVLLIAAAELQGLKVGRIQMGIVQENYYPSENDFIRKVITPGSKLIGVYWNDSNILFESNEYTRAHKKFNYTFKYTRQTLDKLAYFIQETEEKDSLISDYIENYHRKHNRLKGTVGFETLVRAAIASPPVSSKDLDRIFRK